MSIILKDADEVIEAELYIPENRYKYLTYSVVFSTAFVAVAIPNSKCHNF